MRHTVFRFDLDRTYLATDTDSLRALLRVPFERAEDKVAIPGVGELVRSLRQCAEARGERVQLHFLSASPPQIGKAIQDKLKLDGIQFDGIRFKDQMRHIVRGDFSQLREQIGYKLTELLRGAQDMPEGASEYLFGDDWESDAFIYSLYADIVAGRVDAVETRKLLEAVQSDEHYIAQIEGVLSLPRPRFRVAGVFILRARKRRPDELACFGPRLVWFDNYFECSLRMSAAGLLDGETVSRVAAAMRLSPQEIRRSFALVCRRPPSDGAHRYVRGRRSLELSNGIEDLERGARWQRLKVAWRERMGRAALPIEATEVLPHYEALVGRWTHEGVKVAMAEAVTDLEREADAKR